MKAGRTTVVGVGSVLLLLAACASAAPIPPSAGDPLSPPAVYTAGQAERGRQLFAGNCAACHAPQEFSGRLFQVRWEGRSAADYHEFIRVSMPYDAPGRLTDQDYLEIVAYVLQLNGYPPGEQALSADPGILRTLRFR